MTFRFKTDAFQADGAFPIPAAFFPRIVIQWLQLHQIVQHVSFDISACLLTDNRPCLCRTEVVIAIDKDTCLVVAFNSHRICPNRQITTEARP